VGGDTDRVHVRLAELVGALSLGIDLGFGQPMEHVLRQCLIALRLAEHLGLDDQERSNVYYTALLINVGCHTDAHEQAKWFGDGHRVARRREGRAGLTHREIEVLRLLARGLSNKRMAEQLVISPKTLANHVEHIYTKIDASNRAQASLFAMQHGLLPEEGFTTSPALAPAAAHRAPRASSESR
jgi:DNA-binding CsgD family transcriptional regulator